MWPDLNPVRLSSPWAEFLEELDQLLPWSVQLHCVGGFVIAFLYGFPRPTGDIDYVSMVPCEHLKDLQELAGPQSALAKKHRLYLQYVAIPTMPEDYDTRLVELFRGQFENLGIYVVDPYDLILSKLERNSPKDREDIQHRARTLQLDSKLLRDRYEREMRPYLSNQEREDLTLTLWSSYFEEAGENKS